MKRNSWYKMQTINGKNIVGFGGLKNSRTIHALEKEFHLSKNIIEGRSICNWYLRLYIKKELTIADVNCKRCLKILGLNEEFIKKDEFEV